jgi:hypothetical protein
MYLRSETESDRMQVAGLEAKPTCKLLMIQSYYMTCPPVRLEKRSLVQSQAVEDQLLVQNIARHRHSVVSKSVVMMTLVLPFL